MTDVAGVRLSDDRLVFVEGTPHDLPMGAQVRVMLDEEERIGMVSIAPPALIWRDPSAHCATYVRLEQPPDPPALSSAPPVDVLFLAEHEAPDATTLAGMLALARAESTWLDS